MTVKKIELLDNTTWTHSTGTALESLTPLFAEYEVPESIQEKLVADKTQPRIITTKSGVFLNLRAINTNENQDPDDMVSIRFWLTQKGLLSVSLRPLSSVKEMHELKRINTAHECLVELLERIHEKLFLFVNELVDEMSEIEEVILDSNQTMNQVELSQFKLSCLEIYKFSDFQEDVLKSLVAYFKATKQSCTDLSDIVFTLEKTNRNLHSLRERSAIITDELSRQVSEHVSKVSFYLTIFAALIMPMSVLSGLMGMNVPGLPLSGHPYGFWVIVGISMLISAVAIGIYWYRYKRI
jgi:zinc transporter